MIKKRGLVSISSHRSGEPLMIEEYHNESVTQEAEAEEEEVKDIMAIEAGDQDCV
jgi:hypothetical protein